jgi:hypothetical protein
MTDVLTPSIDTILVELDQLIIAPDDDLRAEALRHADKLLTLGEATLEIWLASRKETPTMSTAEGFRMLALHRQGARGDPSFNACRETCRELVYHYNLVKLDHADPHTSRRLRLGAMLARHLAFFVGGKIETAQVGEFCCSSRPLHGRETSA